MVLQNNDAQGFSIFAILNYVCRYSVGLLGLRFDFSRSLYLHSPT